jgi:hypothetical protein
VRRTGRRSDWRNPEDGREEIQRDTFSFSLESPKPNQAMACGAQALDLIQNFSLLADILHRFNLNTGPNSPQVNY